MSPRVRYLSTTVALVALAAAYVFWQDRLERPTPRLPAASAPVIRPASPDPVPLPPTAREILDRVVALDLSDHQVIRLRALDRLWTSEASGQEAAIRGAEAEFSTFMNAARESGGASMQEIQSRSAELRRLSALLRERRQQHSDVAVGLLADWQRQRLARAAVATSDTRRDR
jgi:hypothetical protein